MAEQQLALAINGREQALHRRLVAYPVPVERPSTGDGAATTVGVATEPGNATETGTVAVVGLGYVGLPTALALQSTWSQVVGIDISAERLRAVAAGDVDLLDDDLRQLKEATATGAFRLTDDSAELAGADAVIICVPTPVDDNRSPDLTALRGACASVVRHAHPGQVIILTSTSFVGTTRQLLIEPLAERGMTVGVDVHVAFSPERIDPGNPDHQHRQTPRVVGGATAECSTRAARIVGHMTQLVYLVSSPEAAELTKLYENVFRAVTLALANEFADICGNLGLDPIEVTVAASTKPYGFLGVFPGPGVGGHCIPCDPHYLLWQLREQHRSAPLIEQAMRLIQIRPHRVVDRAVDLLTDDDVPLAGARVLVVGVSYKAGVRDLRESSALPIIAGLTARGVRVSYHDPLMPSITLPDGAALTSQDAPDGQDWDLVVVHTVHPGFDYDWVRTCPRVLDATYQFDIASHRRVV